MKRVLVLGRHGMLANAFHELRESQDFNLMFTSRKPTPDEIKFEFPSDNLEFLIQKVKPEFVINCIGLIPQKLKRDSLEERAFSRLNIELPIIVSKLAARLKFRNIQIATDCVFSGTRGGYCESDEPDSEDLYGRSKFKGEVQSEWNYIIRSSIVGKEENSNDNLLSWFLSHKEGAIIKGYTNHFWNGVTTKAFAKIALGTIRQNFKLNQKQHLVPRDQVSKFDLLNLMKVHFGREDLSIVPYETANMVNRTLLTKYPEANKDLWRLGGYHTVPRIEDLIVELKNSR